MPSPRPYLGQQIAFITMGNYRDADQALQKIKNLPLNGANITAGKLTSFILKYSESLAKDIQSDNPSQQNNIFFSAHPNNHVDSADGSSAFVFSKHDHAGEPDTTDFKDISCIVCDSNNDLHLIGLEKYICTKCISQYF
jgi:hypothetical protein